MSFMFLQTQLTQSSEIVARLNPAMPKPEADADLARPVYFSPCTSFEETEAVGLESASRLAAATRMPALADNLSARNTFRAGKTAAPGNEPMFAVGDFLRRQQRKTRGSSLPK